MRRFTLVLAFVVTAAMSVSPAAQETVSLTEPILARAGISEMRPAQLSLDVEHGVIHIVMKEWASGSFVDDGRQVSVRYDSAGSSGSTGVTTTEANIGMSLIIALNKANLSTAGNSLAARIMKRLTLDGHLAGTVSGDPQ